MVYNLLALLENIRCPWLHKLESVLVLSMHVQATLPLPYFCTQSHGCLARCYFSFLHNVLLYEAFHKPKDAGYCMDKLHEYEGRACFNFI